GGDVSRGMLWLAHALRLIPEDNADLRRAVRANLAAWRARLHPLRDILDHPAAVRAAAFSPDGRYVLTACADQKARLWDVAAGQRVGPALKHPERILALAFPDGHTILTGCADGSVRVWEAGDPEPWS